MKELKNETKVTIYIHSELTEEQKRVVNAAIDACSNAYAPFSGFRVGAACLLSDGSIITGANQEDEAYPSGLCAERVALFHLFASNPKAEVKLMAIVAKKGDGRLTDRPITPCGACRQVMHTCEKRQKLAIELLMVGQDEVMRVSSVTQLLPLTFEL